MGIVKGKIKGWKACKIERVSEKSPGQEGKGPHPTIYSPTHPKTKLHPSRNGEQKNNMKGAWASKNLDPKVKLQQAFVLEENASLEAPPNLLTEFVEVGP